MKSQNPHKGSSFRSLLEEEGIYEEVMAGAMKKIKILKKKAFYNKHKNINRLLLEEQREDEALMKIAEKRFAENSQAIPYDKIIWKTKS